MTLPKRVQLGHNTIQLKTIESGVALDIGDQQGSYSYRANIIYLDEERLEGSQGVELLLHEIGHAIFYQYNLEKTKEEESIVNAMSQGYTEILKRNPLLLKWIIQELGKK